MQTGKTLALMRAFGVALLLISPICAAEPFLGVGLGASAPAFTGNNQFGLGSKATLGYNFDSVPIVLDVNFLTTGRMRDTTAGPKSRFYGGTGTVGYRLDLGESMRSSVQFKLGYYEGRSMIWAREGPDPEDRTPAYGVVFGLMGERRLLPKLGLRFGVDVLFDVPDFSGRAGEELIGDGDSEMLVFTVGVSFGSGDPRMDGAWERRTEARRQRREAAVLRRQAAATRKQELTAARDLAEARERELKAARELEEIREREAARERDAAAREQELAAAAAVQSPEPPAAVAPQVPAAAFAAGQTVLLKPNATLRSRPLPDGAVLPHSDGAQFRLGQSLRNTAGQWWYVSAAGVSGWVLESELGPIQP